MPQPKQGVRPAAGLIDGQAATERKFLTGWIRGKRTWSTAESASTARSGIVSRRPTATSTWIVLMNPSLSSVSRLRSACAWLTVVLGALTVQPVVAAPDPFNVNNPTAGELARLPEYCMYTITYHRGGPADPVRAQWLATLGPTLAHLHHYCWALVIENRLLAGGIPPHTRAAMLRRCIADILYVLRNGEPDFVLMPELLYRLGTYHTRLGEWPEAVDYFEQSRGRKPDYWPAYVELSNVHLQFGRRQRAIEILNEGLQFAPQQKELLEQLRQLESRPQAGRVPAVPASR